MKVRREPMSAHNRGRAFDIAGLLFAVAGLISVIAGEISIGMMNVAVGMMFVALGTRKTRKKQDAEGIETEKGTKTGTDPIKGE
jgi:hypothetical protein